MQRGKKIPKKPRFDFVTKTAYDFLLECGYSTFPISPYDVLDELREYVVCLSWSEARKVLNSDDPFHLMQLKAEGRTVRMRDTGKYYIVYDDVTINSPDRISWTIMHEIGHVILGHLVDFNETALKRGGITNEQYGVLEVEAHYFAAEFLMPTAILKYLPDITVERIALLFGVSDAAAEKKYKRVFGTSYLPYDAHEEKLLRNFYEFLMTGVDDVIYKSIYRMWGLPWKTKYISVCRKCPNCLSYIDDPKEEYCRYCGCIIEQPHMYKNMHERLKELQEFRARPGVSHLKYPYIKIETTQTMTKYERITICPTCLNYRISENEKYCRLCGQPLRNMGSDGETIKAITDCFSRNTGKETSSNSWYPKFEKRYRTFMEYKGVLQEDWVKYPYWEFTKWMVRSNRSNASTNLQSAILYSSAFMDDNDDIHIITDTRMAANTIQNEQKDLLACLARTDKIKRLKIDVIITDVL